MSFSKQRKELTAHLSAHLEQFDSDLQGMFQCPVCMNVTSVADDPNNFTVGHILPEATGGRAWIILCNRCNSSFGKSQDKWLGEYLNVLLDPQGTFFHAKTKSKYIEVNGETVSGNIQVANDGTVNIFLPINRNPPGKVSGLDFREKTSINFTPELLKHEKEIEVGFLTSAYLLWYEAIGYNWVYQSSLEGIRRQILNPKDDLIDDFKIIDLPEEKFHDPSLVILSWKGHAYPACLLYDKVVVFPPPEGSNVPKFDRSIQFSNEITLLLVDLSICDKPFSICCGGSIVVLPNMIKKRLPIPEFMLNLPFDEQMDPQWLSIENRHDK